MNDIANVIPTVIIAILLITMLYRIVRYRSIAGALFGARVVGNLGKVAAADPGHMPVEVRVHALDSAVPYRAIGVELVAKALGHTRFMPITLSREQALQLAGLLTAAAEHRASGMRMARR